MAANAIKRLPAPKTGGVRHPCVFCNSRGYTDKKKKEQQELLNLMSETDFLRQGNYRRERKLRKFEKEMKTITNINLEMDEFFNNISLTKVIDDKLSINIGTQTDVEDKEAEKLEKVKDKWRKKERRTAQELGKLQSMVDKSCANRKGQTVPVSHWGHKTITWTRPGHRRPSPSGPSSTSTFASNSPWQKSFNPKQNFSKPFSIPFRPKPLHLMVRKAYLKPPPKLPPPVHFQVAQVNQPTARLSATMQCADDQVNIEAREMFADALERAVNSEHNIRDQNDVSWAEHPHYDDLDSPEPIREALHPYCDDLEGHDPVRDAEDPYHDEIETVCDVEGMSKYDEDNSDDAELSNVPWEDHPFYDTPEEESQAEHDDPADDAACNDNSSEEDVEDQVAWEDSPFY